MPTLFFYGTLCHAPLLRAVLGRDPGILPVATLADHAVSRADGQDFPMIHADLGGQVRGVVLDASDDDVARLDFYEGGFAYTLRQMAVQVDGASILADVYFADPGHWQPGAGWDLSEWVARWGDITVDAAQEFMRQFGQIDAKRAQLVRPYVLSRAWGRHLAQTPVPTTRRAAHGWDDLVFAERDEGFDGFFRLASFDVSFRRFNGDMSDTIRREAFVAFDAALVLPYDPVRDRVLFVEQFRYGPLARRDPHPWVFEPIAGLVDAGEDPEACARREAEEEAGLQLGQMERMLKVYASPGYSSEYFHCYLGLCDLEDGDGRIGGLDHESEDIRAHVVSFDAAMALMDSGEINAGPLVMMLLWLARHRARLRTRA